MVPSTCKRQECQPTKPWAVEAWTVRTSSHTMSTNRLNAPLVSKTSGQNKTWWSWISTVCLTDFVRPAWRRLAPRAPARRWTEESSNSMAEAPPQQPPQAPGSRGRVLAPVKGKAKPFLHPPPPRPRPRHPPPRPAARVVMSSLRLKQSCTAMFKQCTESKLLTATAGSSRPPRFPPCPEPAPLKRKR